MYATASSPFFSLRIFFLVKIKLSVTGGYALAHGPYKFIDQLTRFIASSESMGYLLIGLSAKN